MDLYQQCEDLFAHHRGSVQKDRDSCSKDFLDITTGGETYHLSRAHGRHPTFGLFPKGQYAGHGSFAFRDGTFQQHGTISRDGFERIVTAGIPEAEAAALRKLAEVATDQAAELDRRAEAAGMVPLDVDGGTL